MKSERKTSKKDSKKTDQKGKIVVKAFSALLHALPDVHNGAFALLTTLFSYFLTKVSPLIISKSDFTFFETWNEF